MGSGVKGAVKGGAKMAGKAVKGGAKMAGKAVKGGAKMAGKAAGKVKDAVTGKSWDS